MTVTEETPGRLVIEFRPWREAAVLAGLILLMALLGVRLWPDKMAASLAVFGVALAMVLCFAIFIRLVRVTFDADADAVVMRTTTLLGRSEQRLKLSEVQGAHVETSFDRSLSSHGDLQRRKNTHRPVLRTAGAVVPMTRIYAQGRGALRAAEAVNRWLEALRGGDDLPPADLTLTP